MLLLLPFNCVQRGQLRALIYSWPGLAVCCSELNVIGVVETLEKTYSGTSQPVSNFYYKNKCALQYAKDLTAACIALCARIVTSNRCTAHYLQWGRSLRLLRWSAKFMWIPFEFHMTLSQPLQPDDTCNWHGGEPCILIHALYVGASAAVVYIQLILDHRFTAFSTLLYPLSTKKSGTSPQSSVGIGIQ